MLYIAKDILKEQPLAEDAVQDAFLYLAMHIKSIDEKVLKAILDLPKNYQECLELHIVYEMPAKKIAALTGINYETVKKGFREVKKY